MSYKDMKSRIAALRDKAQNRGASEAEAMSAATKAEKLMRKHGITLEDVERSRADGGASVTIKTVRTDRIRQHEVDLICTSSIAKFTDTRSFYSHAEIDAVRQWCTVFIGYGPDVALAVWLRETIKAAMDAEWLQFKAGPDYITGRGRKQRRQFLFAMGGRIARRLSAMKAARDTAAQETQTGRALIIGKSAAVNATFDRATAGGLGSARGLAANMDGAATRAGRAAGQAVSLGRPVEASTGPALLAR